MAKRRRDYIGFTAGCLVLITAGALAWGAMPTTVNGMRTQTRHEQGSPPYTRLIFYISGDRPSITPSANDLVIAFDEARSLLRPDYPITDPAATVSGVKAPRTPKALEITIPFRKPGSLTYTETWPSYPPHGNYYRLVVYVFPPPEAQPEEPAVPAAPAPAPVSTATEAPKSEAPAPQETQKAADPEPHQESKPAAPAPEPELSPALKEASQALDQGDYAKAHDLYKQLVDPPQQQPREQLIALYGLADSSFLLHQHELEQSAPEILLLYMKALKADPATPMPPLAQYRCAVCYEAIGDMKKAGALYDQIIQTNPQHPTVPFCWLGLGRKAVKAHAYPEAVQAFRNALQFPFEKKDRAQALFHLGQALYLNGQHAEALQPLQQCLNEDPKFYVQEPQILKALGESSLSVQQYDKSRDYLLRYLNLQQDAEDKDMILTTLAEIFSLERDETLATRLRKHIQRTFPSSEGDAICKIRKAETLENGSESSQQKALAIYRELSQTDIPAPLLKLVRMKYADKQLDRGNFQESLAVVDHVLQEAPHKAPDGDFLALRSRTILKWAATAFSKQDYAQVIQLYEQNKDIFTSEQSRELTLMLAQSYAQLGAYSNAIEFYQQVLSKENGKNNEEILLRVAQIYFQEGDLEKAAQTCTPITAAALREEKALLLGQIFFAQKNYSKVVEAFHSLQDKGKPAPAPDSRWAAITGESLAELGEYEKAVPPLLKAVDALKAEAPGSDRLARIYRALSKSYRKLNKTREAGAVLEEAISTVTSEEFKDQFLYDLSKIYILEGQPEQAVEQLKKLLASSQSFWQTVARQQIDYIQLQK